MDSDAIRTIVMYKPEVLFSDGVQTKQKTNMGERDRRGNGGKNKQRAVGWVLIYEKTFFYKASSGSI